ncbi:MAG: hypothetical protein PHR35_08295, partial [Kiritimatiellae bacterium]|nr:hypothetical protein [Kiritimatiellia bacterium]
SGSCDVSQAQAREMAGLGLKWHEIHEHFPAYGNYHPENVESWTSGHTRDTSKTITVDTIRRTIRNLHAAGAAALPYIQVTGDGDEALLDKAFEGCRIRDEHGCPASAWPQTYLMNSDPSLPFGRDIQRQIRGMVGRYPEMDGVFLDQPCYNFLDTAHDDGLTAVDNRPAYMTGFNYYPHLELLSSLLHPNKAIIANAPFSVGILKYIDGFMAESAGWLCDHLQYYGLAKPLFFLCYDSSDRNIERMFQQCLLYGAGFTSYAKALGSKDLYAQYMPVLQRLYRRRWIFDPEPLQTPEGIKGKVYRSERGTFVASLVGDLKGLAGRVLPSAAVTVRAAGVADVEQVTLHAPGAAPLTTRFAKHDDRIEFDLPGDWVAGVAELS